MLRERFWPSGGRHVVPSLDASSPGREMRDDAGPAGARIKFSHQWLDWSQALVRQSRGPPRPELLACPDEAGTEGGGLSVASVASARNVLAEVGQCLGLRKVSPVADVLLSCLGGLGRQGVVRPDA